MTVQIRNSKQLIDPSTFKWKVLIIGQPGSGKTLWASQAPNPGIVACETGQGSGLLTVAESGVDFIEPTNLADFDAVASGLVFKDKETIVIDSLSDMTRTFIKDHALSIPRRGLDSPKRSMGIPELDDYGTMGELTRRLLRKVLSLDKHVVVTALLKVQQPDPETGRGELMIGPDLPGQMFYGAPAMFDTVLILRTRPKLANPRDAKSRYTERYFITQPDGTHMAKCRSNHDGKPILDAEEIFDIADGRGAWGRLFAKIQAGYAASK